MSSHSKFWAPNSGFMGFLKGSAGHQVIRNMLVVNRWARAGLETWGCLDRNTRGVCFGKFVYRRRQRKAGMGNCLHMGPCYLSPGLILRLN
jgi:hypothetical protein